MSVIAGLLVNEPQYKRRLELFRNHRALRQFITTLDENGDSSGEDEFELANALEGVTVHSADMDKRESSGDDSENGMFAYLACIDNDNPCSVFTAKLQDVSIMHTLTSMILSSIYADKFYGVMIDSGRARGSSSGRVQYL